MEFIDPRIAYIIVESASVDEITSSLLRTIDYGLSNQNKLAERTADS